MTDCAEIRPLVEKLHDLEATAAEKLAAHAHLEKCANCRSHFEFLDTLSEESRSMTFDQPPESYWEHLPRKVLDRIDSEGARPSGFFALLLAPSMLRWAGLGATLVLIGAVGVSVLREEPRGPASPPASVSLPAEAPPVLEAPPASEAPAAPEARARSNDAPSGAPPPMARDETPAVSEPSADSERNELAFDAATRPPEPAVSLASSAEEGESALEERAIALKSANRTRAAAAPAQPARYALEDCESMRDVADSLGATPSGADARYGLALCSLQKHERAATEDDKTRAIEDSEAFLALESEGVRAEEVRDLLRRIKPN